MNLVKLFEMQKALDDHISEEQSLTSLPFTKRCLALVVELGECANEEKSFKFWKVPENRKPNTEGLKNPFGLKDVQVLYNPLLEEYVDCLHFIISLGLSIGIDPSKVGTVVIYRDKMKRISLANHNLNLIQKVVNFNYKRTISRWFDIYNNFLLLGALLGFDLEQIEKCYYEKNEENHKRQEGKY